VEFVSNHTPTPVSTKEWQSIEDTRDSFAPLRKKSRIFLIHWVIAIL